jgi:hypothetical protein
MITMMAHDDDHNDDDDDVADVDPEFSGMAI